MSVDTSSPSTSAAKQKTTRHYVKKPNQEEKDAQIKEIEANIEKLRPQLDDVRNRIAVATGKSEDGERAELRSRLSVLRDRQAEIKKSKQVKIDQMTALNNSLKKKIADLRVTQDKLPYKTQEAIDTQIANLEKQVDSGSLKLVEERRVLSEISNLKKARKTVELNQAQQAAIDADKAAIAALKETIDDSETKALSAEYNEVQAKLDEINKAKDEDWKKRNDLFDERTRLQGEIDAEYQHKKAVNDEYFAALREFNKFQQEEKVRRQKEFQAKKQQEKEELLLAKAREERELAEIPAFSNEIITCESVYKYLIQFSNDEKHIAEAAAAAAAAPVATSNLNIRKADTTTNVPSGSMLVKKADKEEEVFFVGKSKKNKGPKEKKVETTTTTNATFKIHHTVLQQLIELDIPVPRSQAELGNTLDALVQKKDHFKANQAKQTEENKRKAEERIAKLTLDDNADSTEDGSEKTAEVTA
ncbi:MAG: hypothetical protein J3Q66DRAFT_319206 [Benniella sp.]|nr:MAG: hypothetical protein J3Q66DRAFT_319206 [Benniella sp.]